MTNSPSHPPTSPPDLGLLLRGLRREAGLTQEELAERAGISTRAVSDIERGLRSRIYRDTADRLASALLLSPTDREQLLAASRHQTEAPAPVASLPAPPPRRLHGRDAQVDLLAGWLSAAAGPRLVTVTGPGGVGKTRLALEAAHRLVGHFPAVYFVPLAPVSVPAAVPAAILRALELPDSGDPAAGITARASPAALLVIDNFEHVLDAAEWLAGLTATAPGLRLLVTSRAPLRVRVEQELPLGPLADDMALELFRERVVAVRPELDWGPGELAAADRVCALVDRLPLALELAAAALRHLTLASLAEGLDAQVDLLGEGWRDLPERQRTMAATVAWSTDLLAEPERRLLRALSVFRGTAGLAAILEVAGLSEAEAIRGLGRLVEQSLLQRADTPASPRYQLLEVVRQAAFGQAREAEELETLQLRHLTHFVALAETAEPHLHQSDRAEWYGRLAAETDNLAAGLEQAIAHGWADLGLRLATALWRWWRQRGDYNQGRRQLRQLLALPGSNSAVRARALWGASWLAIHQQDHAETRRVGQELLALAETTGDALQRRNGLTAVGMATMNEARCEDSVPLFREALELAREASDPWILATSTINLARPLLETGEHGEAGRLIEEARAQYVRLGDTGFGARMLLYQALWSLGEEDVVTAAARVSRAAADFTAIDEIWGQIESLEFGSSVLAAAGRDVPAAHASGAASAAHERLGSVPLPLDAAALSVWRAGARARAGADWDEAVSAGAEAPLSEAVREMLRELMTLVAP